MSKRARLPVRMWLTLWNAGILGVALFVLGIAVRVIVRAYLMDSVDRELKGRANAFHGGMPPHRMPPDGPMGRDGEPGNGNVGFSEGMLDNPFSQDVFRGGWDRFGEQGPRGPRDRNRGGRREDSDPFFPRYFDRQGNPMDGRDREYGYWDKSTFTSALAGEPAASTITYKGEHLRIYSSPVRRPNQSIEGVVQIPLRLTDIERGLAAVDRTLLTLLPLALLVTVSGGVLLTNRAIRPIEQALEQEKRFVADASHELRTPLSIIKTAAELGLEAAEDEEHDATPALRRALERVTVATERTQRIVEDLMLLARAESVTSPPTGTKPPMLLTLEPILARDFLTETACLFDPIRGQRAIAVEVVTKNLVVWVDRHHMGRALSNLIDNAVRHTDPERGIIVLAAFSTGDQIVITVSDNGEGIPAADVPNLFRRFYRPDVSRVRTRGGSGLGLSIAKAVVEAHGGGITIESVEGAGTMVRLYLPIGKPS